ncbi:hypothetical protein MGYG_02817 [Nannizzia gypsea CBS 118893]|uniref:DNA ligase D 3'-phosphoesterase domain-containing protein n=1 Tax=Arthroderma gypseum (strain ATCC MYA-4604 / CBS 118893) TaxID=535722 RepID=E4UP79_ARTGP|nr:hypothetical protein MGYG_02817 [Nannizzia gypsea CBS 118893]EFQ99805.1 hypothetical protein MGYG_02817 [Nannizzia gypsea CBS 118893]
MMEEKAHGARAIENPFVKPENQGWTVSLHRSLVRSVSPPPARGRKRRRGCQNPRRVADEDGTKPEDQPHSGSNVDIAAIEAGKEDVEDHLGIFSARLRASTRAELPQVPRLAHSAWRDLYLRNQHDDGRHFVVHQHDHPIAGPHYDLRLQFSRTSSLSFAIMYGLPGNPNSKRLSRNATETRVHNLWNHLIESASAASGSMIIWDTGEYSVLPYYDNDALQTDQSDASISAEDHLTESEKLRRAFHQRKIRLRLHGTRLPPNYTVTLRLARGNNASRQPTKRRRTRDRRKEISRRPELTSSDSEELEERPSSDQPSHSDQEDEIIRQTNAYRGATNSLASIYQRTWYMTLDRVNSGFDRCVDSTRAVRWARKEEASPGNGASPSGFEPFFVRGPDFERSVLTGRLGSDVLSDEAVVGFRGRRGWRAVLE